MRISARGKVLFCLVTAFIAVLFYLQPRAEAKAAFNTTIDARETIQQFNQDNNQQTLNLQTENQQQNITEMSSEMNAVSAVVSEARSFRATAYCLQGRTATGGGVRRGIVAADPRILPLGTRIQVSAGSYSGTYTVADTGGAIRGRILDVWVPTCSEAMRFGRKTVSVSIVGKK